MNEQIKREEAVYGKQWDLVHGGYFSDPLTAAPLVRKVEEFASKSGTNVIVDLGGGSGFVLSRLLANGIERGVSLLVNLDDSAIQLEATTGTELSCVRGSVDSFSRRDVGPKDGHFLFMMRSVLHYFGQDGLRPVLRHLRAQARPGEFFVHQTGSFSDQQNADCLNELYQMMRTKKWYPTVDFLCECLRAEGWQVLEVLPGVPLPLESKELMQRYNLDKADVLRITRQLPRDSLVSEEVFKKTKDSFCAFLHYWIYICTPAISGKFDENEPKRTEQAY